MTDLKVLNLGAGVQSTALLGMELDGNLPEEFRTDCAIFADTGWEPAEVYEHVDALLSRAKRVGYTIHVVTAGNIKADVTERILGGPEKFTRVGQPPFMSIDRTPKTLWRCESCSNTVIELERPDYACTEMVGMEPLPGGAGKVITCGQTHWGEVGPAPEDKGGRLWRQCTREYKIEPIVKKIRGILGYKKGERVKKTVKKMFGISTDEITRMRISSFKWAENVYPLIEMRMNRHDCQKYNQLHGYPDGVPKSACIACPYHSNAKWRFMRKNRPDDWAESVAFDHFLRQQEYPYVKGSVYIHRDCVPLDEVDLDTAEDRGQLTMFDEECEGMCGV